MFFSFSIFQESKTENNNVGPVENNRVSVRIILNIRGELATRSIKIDDVPDTNTIGTIKKDLGLEWDDHSLSIAAQLGNHARKDLEEEDYHKPISCVKVSKFGGVRVLICYYTPNAQ